MYPFTCDLVVITTFLSDQYFVGFFAVAVSLFAPSLFTLLRRFLPFNNLSSVSSVTSVVKAVSYAPPNTSTSPNTHAGDAWPTRTIWFGSPLPQLGLPITAIVERSPTFFRLRQKVAEIPR